MNYYERHLGDYARDTAHLSMLEHGAYGLLLDRYYATETGIPADQAHRLARAKTPAERAAVDVVLAEFFTLADGLWINSRAAREIEKAQTKIEAARRNGKTGGRPKKNPDGTQEKPTGLSLGSENGTQSKALQTPDTIEEPSIPSGQKERKRSPLTDCPDGVDPQVWTDWLLLRKQKKAPVTATVIDGATREAAKAGITLDAFLRVWCVRGSQGLQAEWLTAAERRMPASVPTEPAWRTEQRERNEAFLGPAASRRAPIEPPPETIDVTALLLD